MTAKRAGGAVETSRLAGFYKLDPRARVDEIARLAGLDDDDRRVLTEMHGFGLAEADRMIENVVGILPLPIGIAANFKIDGIDRLVPMAIEEPSVVAAASNSARRMREGRPPSFPPTARDAQLLGGTIFALVEEAYGPTASVEPMTCPPFTPPPASHMLKPCGLWSRPLVPSVIGVRPNSPPQMTSVSFSSPRRFRSVSNPAIG